MEDISTASKTILELRNSLVPVNVLPLDVLLLIPTHLTSLGDRLRTTFVCRHWRRAFLQHSPIWSQLHLTGWTSRHLLATLLERAKQSPLDVTLDYSNSQVSSVALLSPCTPQIRNLTLSHPSWDEIQSLSVAISGYLPLLHTLAIEDIEDDPDPQTFPLFEGAANMKKFVLAGCSILSLPHFAFPNLTIFRIETSEEEKPFPASPLLNFLEASPLLQKVEIATSDVSFEDVPLDRVISLPHVTDFCLAIVSDWIFDWRLATHLSCPSVELARFARQPALYDDKIPEDAFPSLLQWTAIVRQYTIGMVEEAKLKFEVNEGLTCSVTFWSPNGASLDLIYHHPIEIGGNGRTALATKIWSDLFSQACRTIRDHPSLTNVGTLSIKGGGLLTGNLELTTNDVGKLLGSMGPLKRLHFDNCDLRPYLDSFLETPLFPDAIQPTSFPPIEKFRVINPIQSLCDNVAYATAIVKLVQSQRARGVPFKDVKCEPPLPSWAVEGLTQGS